MSEILCTFAAQNKIVGMRIFSHIISDLFTPLLVPTYGIFISLWLSVFYYVLPFGTRLTVLLTVFGITFIMPSVLIAALHNFKFIEDKRLVKRTERYIPYAFTVLCYIGAVCYLNHIHAQMWMLLSMGAAAVAVLVCSIVNLWWKVSAHSCGMGGLLALIWAMHDLDFGATDLFPVLLVGIVLCGLVGTAGLALGRHTFGQVFVGWLIGFVIEYATMMLMY